MTKGTTTTSVDDDGDDDDDDERGYGYVVSTPRARGVGVNGRETGRRNE